MDKPKKATKAQQERIRNMLASGLIDRDEAQSLIAKHRRATKPKKPQEPDVDADRLAFWEERFPGNGAALMDILRPFYGWKPELKPALPDLEERAKRAIFWRQVPGVKAFTPRDRYLLKNSLVVSPHNSHNQLLGVSLRDSLWESLRDSLWFSLGFSLGESLRDSLWVLLEGSLCGSLRDSLICACGLILSEKPEEAIKFSMFVKIWLAGNFPLGFDQEGCLLVLVAD